MKIERDFGINHIRNDTRYIAQWNYYQVSLRMSAPNINSCFCAFWNRRKLSLYRNAFWGNTVIMKQDVSNRKFFDSPDNLFEFYGLFLPKITLNQEINWLRVYLLTKYHCRMIII